MCEIYEEYNAKRGFGVRESIDFYVVFALAAVLTRAYLQFLVAHWLVIVLPSTA